MLVNKPVKHIITMWLNKTTQMKHEIATLINLATPVKHDIIMLIDKNASNNITQKHSGDNKKITSET
jgi:hypothetical protein